MGRLGQPTESVYSSRTRGDCNERALVLQAAGIEYEILRAGGECLLVVAARDAERAVAELDAYARESHDGPPHPVPLPEQSSGWQGVYAYVAVLLLIAILQDRHAFSSDWLALGKTQAGLVCQGEWWRTVTALSLHLGAAHLVANLIFGGLFGLFVGRLLGSGLAWASILATGALGNAMNAWIQPANHSAVGASTAVFGALGILSAYAWKQRRGIEGGWFRRWTPVVGGVVLLAYTGLGGERTDIIAHVTGFISGLLLGGLYGTIGRRILVKARTQSALGLTALAFLTLCWVLALSTNG
jgi:membrane associated rhomboid family serine protease